MGYAHTSALLPLDAVLSWLTLNNLTQAKLNKSRNGEKY